MFSAVAVARGLEPDALLVIGEWATPYVTGSVNADGLPPEALDLLDTLSGGVEELRERHSG